MSGATKQIKQLGRSAEHQGFEVSIGKGGHYRFRSPDKRSPLIFVSATPSDTRALKNSVAQLRRAGFTG